MQRLRDRARCLWTADNVAAKCEGVLAMWREYKDLAGDQRARARHEHACMLAHAVWPASATTALRDVPIMAGRPENPPLVDPRRVPKRGGIGEASRLRLLHAIAHIEFNAINLALDAIWRYPSMPAAFALDWLAVAADECLHFGMVEELLNTRGAAYGDFAAHDGLWQMAMSTHDNLLARMALVPRVLEARGLDATPPIQARLRAAGDDKAVRVLQRILDDEIGHVRIGDRWFRCLARRAGKDAEATYRELIADYNAPRPRGQINHVARRAAGFSATELDWLASYDTVK